MVDTRDSKSLGSNVVRVQFPLRAPKKSNNSRENVGYFLFLYIFYLLKNQVTVSGVWRWCNKTMKHSIGKNFLY